MLTKYCKLVREYVALKQDAVKDEPGKLQNLQNIITLNQSFINDVHMMLPKQQQAVNMQSGGSRASIPEAQPPRPQVINTS
jgi:hypothetical protein